MPLTCQIKLLVALQERQITRVGDNAPQSVDVRVIAAMGMDPFDAIDAGQLREDLYYRLAVFVSHLPPLRTRREDIPLLASHFLEQTRSRYNLPPIRLSEPALDALLEHSWPGNVRELANALDRAALLARDGVIHSIQFNTRRRGAVATTGAVEALEHAARCVVEAMEQREALRTLETSDAFRGAVLLEVIRRLGGKDEGFVWLGLERLVKNRNHHRALKRETARLQQLSRELGEALSSS